MLSSGVNGGVVTSCRPVVSSALNAKVGSGAVDFTLLCAIGTDCDRGPSICIDTGRLLMFGARRRLLCGADGGGSMGNEKCGFGTMSICGPAMSGAPGPMELKLWVGR